MFRILDKLENSKYPLLGPTIFGLTKWSMWQPDRRISILWYNYIHIFGTLFVLSQYIELWFLRSNVELALRNLSVTMLSTICVVKAITFIYWEEKWYSVMEYVSDLEKHQLDKNDSDTNRIIKEYTKYSRSVTYFYWCLVTATVITVVLAPLVGYMSSTNQRYLMKNGTLPYPEILSSWLPFDRTRGYGYWISVLEHAAICVYGGGIVATYDSNAVALMSFFAGQLKLLSINCNKLFGDGTEVISYGEAISRIKECHHHHVNLVKFALVLNTLLSPVMFLYVIICSLMICASAIQLTTDETGNMQRIWIAEYLLALIAQLLLYCWHGNEVLYMFHAILPMQTPKLCLKGVIYVAGKEVETNKQSNVADEGVYSSAWWAQDVRVRRNVLLLGGQLRKRIVFIAGPFTVLSVSTFIAIMKGSYSYYTLLSKRED